MKIISHRGNINGKNPPYENTLDYLKHAFNIGFDVECDLIEYRGLLYFGHDEPQELADLPFLQSSKVWCHAKDLNALQLLMNMGTNCFWHESDSVTLTSYGFIWCYPGNFPIHKKAVWLDLFNTTLPEDKSNIYGICTDVGLQY